MTLQKNTYIVPALGKQGQESRQDPICQGSPYFAETDSNGNQVVAGGFVFSGTTDKQVKAFGEAAAVPLGVAVFQQYQIGITPNCNINHGEVVKVDYRGCVFAKPFENAATKGQKVFVNPTNGKIQATSQTQIDNYVDTGWIVKTGNSQGEVVEIERI